MWANTNFYIFFQGSWTIFWNYWLFHEVLRLVQISRFPWEIYTIFAVYAEQNRQDWYCAITIRHDVNAYKDVQHQPRILPKALKDD